MKHIYTDCLYQCPFFSWVKRIWRYTSFFGSYFIRKLERKIFFTLEFGFKSIYAKLIGFGAQTAYDPSDGLVTMHINADPNGLKNIDERINLIHNFGENNLIVTLPRWGEFTEIIPKLADAGTEFIEI